MTERISPENKETLSKEVDEVLQWRNDLVLIHPDKEYFSQHEKSQYEEAKAEKMYIGSSDYSQKIVQTIEFKKFYASLISGTDSESRGLNKIREKYMPLSKLVEKDDSEKIGELKNEAEKFLVRARLSLLQSLLLKKEKEEIGTRNGNQLFRYQGN